MKTFKFQCPFCDKKYKVEKAFMKHTCDEMVRAEEIKTPAGQRAYHYYSQWNQMRGFAIPPEGTFITSTYYKAFQRFGGFVDKAQLPAPKEYIKLMVKKTLPPSAWTDILAYKHYMNHMDKRMSPQKQASIAVDTIFDYCEANGNIPTDDFFDHINPNEFVQYVVKRKLSPWILFNSKKFISYYSDKMSIHNRHTFDEMYSPSEWSYKFKDNAETVAEMKELVAELGL